MRRFGATFAHRIENCAMGQTPNFNSYIENTIVNNWNKDALTDYKGVTLQFHDVARKIEKLHIMFESSGIVKGDKIALCGRNSCHWAVTFLAVLTYGAVAVPIQHEFTREQIHNIVNHSEARLLFVGDFVATEIDKDAMPLLQGIISLPDFSLIDSRTEKLSYAREHLNAMFGLKYPKFFRAEQIQYYHEHSADELAVINYTSGTTGSSKGVMLPYCAIKNNVDCVIEKLGDKARTGSNIVSTLPMAHMYGLVVEFLFGFINGCHIHFLTRLPSLSLIAEMMAEIKPSLVVTVPLVVEKMIRKHVFPEIQNNRMRLLLNMPVINKKVKQRIKEKALNIFGGNAYEVIVGGAPINKDIEWMLHSIQFPLTVAYGTTETAPLITFDDYHDYQINSCGRVVKNMEVKINSNDPETVPGELLTRGENVMLGYYKNEEATSKVIDNEGWFHTGDLATRNADGHIFITGRIKNMLLGANGQNIYPEEIENKLNSMPLVNESLIVQKGNALVALVHPDVEESTALDFTDEDLHNVMEENIATLNKELPAYSRIAAVQIHPEEFQKTAKKSIKRYLYQDSAC